MAKSKKVRLKSDIEKEAKKAQAKRDAEKANSEATLRKELRQEIKQELREENKKRKERKQRRKELAYEAYLEAEDQRTPEQKEQSDKTYNEVAEFLADKELYSKFGNKLVPRIYWVRPDGQECVVDPMEFVKVVETEKVIKQEVVKEIEVVKPNNTYTEYLNTRDEVPEEVIINGFKYILEEYGINKLDDYTVRKLFYHILISLGHYLDENPEFYLGLKNLHIYREPLKRNVFTIVIPKNDFFLDNVSIESLYNYYAEGGIDIEALNKTLDIYALSYIQYTEVKKSLREKARESANRFQRIVEQTEQAKAMLKAQGITGGPGYKKVVAEVAHQLDLEHRARHQKNTNKVRWAKKDLTNDNIHGIIQEDKERPEDK